MGSAGWWIHFLISKRGYWSTNFVELSVALEWLHFKRMRNQTKLLPNFLCHFSVLPGRKEMKCYASIQWRFSNWSVSHFSHFFSSILIEWLTRTCRLTLPYGLDPYPTFSLFKIFAVGLVNQGRGRLELEICRFLIRAFFSSSSSEQGAQAWVLEFESKCQANLENLYFAPIHNCTTVFIFLRDCQPQNSCNHQRLISSYLFNIERIHQSTLKLNSLKSAQFTKDLRLEGI